MRQTDNLPPTSAPLKRSTAQFTARIRSDRKRSRNLLLNVSIGTRLTLSFIICALIAAVVTGTIGSQHAQSLDKQSNFYLNLLQSNTNLTTGMQFLQAMDSTSQSVLVLVNTPQPSQETLHTNLASLQNLDKLYSATLSSFVANQLVSKHPDEQALLNEANHGQQIGQQGILASSALRTWQVAHGALSHFVSDVSAGHFDNAATLQQVLGEPANADAMTALRSLVSFNKNLAGSIKDAADVEAFNQLIATVISAVLAFLAIFFIGWLISGTLVRRLLLLRQVTQAVENGNLTRRVKVIGRDEIADVSASVNAMLDAISNLIGETRDQRDALVNAADHLFSEMRVVSAGDLRVSAPVSNDPIGLLANAFNFTIGRFRRFVLRSKTLSEQLHVIARREAERAEAFALAIKSIQPQSDARSLTVLPADRSYHPVVEQQGEHHQIEPPSSNTQLVVRLQRTREQLKQVAQEGVLKHNRAVAELYEEMTETLKRLNDLALSKMGISVKTNAVTMTATYIQEVRILDTLRARMAEEIQNIQRNTIRGYQDLDQNLQELYISLVNQSNGNGRVETAPAVVEEDPRLQDLLRLGMTFAYEVTNLSGQLTKLAQDIQNTVVAFQFEGADTLSPHSVV